MMIYKLKPPVTDTHINTSKKERRKEREMEIIKEDVVIVGAGIAGLATALALKRVGVRALVLERSHELRTTGAALSLFPNAWLALHALGVANHLTAIYAPCKKAIFTNVEAGTVQEASLTGPEAIGVRPVHRKTLLEVLAAELPVETIRFSSKLSSIQSHTQDGSTITILRLQDGTIINTKILVGCDGLHSVVARWLGLADPVQSGRFAVRGLAVFPEGHGLKQELQMLVGHGSRVGFATLTDKEIYWFSTGGEELKKGDPDLIQKNVLENSANFPPMFLDIVRHADLSTLSCAPLMFRYPWDLIYKPLCKGNITVAGDAMHPMTPDLGQGGCAALEDAVVLGRHIGNSFLQHGQIVPQEVAAAIEMYVKERRWRAASFIVRSYLSGWIQQEKSGWLIKFFRDKIFYKHLFVRLINALPYDCGKLPSVPKSSEVDTCNKID